MKIGVITDCFRLPLEESIVKAAALGIDGIQVYATTGAFSPDALDSAKKAEIKGLLAQNGLEISALCGDMGGYGFQIAGDNPERIEKTKRIIDLADEFGVSVITTHIGVIPGDKNDPVYKVMLDSVGECGVYAAEKGITLAIETGPEKADTLLAFLKDTSGGIGVNLDPANLVMVTGEDPVYAVRTLKDYIVHTHAKDGVMLKKTDPKIIYDYFASGGIGDLRLTDYFTETPFGEGGVNFDTYMAALREIGYDGYLTIEREVGDDPIKSITEAADYLKRCIGK